MMRVHNPPTCLSRYVMLIKNCIAGYVTEECSTAPLARVNLSPFLDNTELLCRIKMCRRVAHKASTTAATVAGGVADTSLRVADGMVSRMGGSSYGQ